MSGPPLPAGRDPGRPRPSPVPAPAAATCRGSWSSWFVAVVLIVTASVALWVWLVGGTSRPPSGIVAPWPFFPFGLLVGVLVLVLLVRLASAARWGWGAWGRAWPDDDPERILEVRFARGEITREQLRDMRAELHRAT